MAAAWIPSQVDAIFMRTRSFSTPDFLYNEIISSASSIVASVSYDKAAGTSEDTRPGTIFKISAPKATVYVNKNYLMSNKAEKYATKYSRAFFAISSEFDD